MALKCIKDWLLRVFSYYTPNVGFAEIATE